MLLYYSRCLFSDNRVTVFTNKNTKRQCKYERCGCFSYFLFLLNKHSAPTRQLPTMDKCFFPCYYLHGYVSNQRFIFCIDLEFVKVTLLLFTVRIRAGPTWFQIISILQFDVNNLKCKYF